MQLPSFITNLIYEFNTGNFGTKLTPLTIVPFNSCVFSNYTICKSAEDGRMSFADSTAIY